MFITKSLFKEFAESPKLAWYHINNKDTYQKIQEDTYGGMDGETAGQDVENMVKKFYKGKNIVEVDTKHLDYKNWHQSYDTLSIKALEQNSDILYQAGFATESLFAKTDFLVKNEEGKYDLMEVKSKNSIRSDNKNQTLISELVTDVSFQKYVLEKTLGERFSGNCYIIYLNKEFTKHGEINPEEILMQELVNDDLMTNDAIESILSTMESSLSLSLNNFDKKFPYDGGDYFTYFGEKPPKGSIWNIAGIDKNKKKALYESGKIMIGDVTDEDIMTILCNKDGGDSRSSKYMNLWKQGESVINKEEINQILSTLKFPLFFYDYETVASPIPIFDGTKPWQAAVVQYSLHKMDSDGTITHYESIIEQNTPEIKPVVDQFVKDVGEPNGTFIVWNKGFECSRNNETVLIYPEYKDFFEMVNNQTFDLMDIFKNMDYFHRDFNGSASIKKVLPVMTNISYDDLEVGNGGIATALLQKIALGTIDQNDYQSTVKNLLTYCEQDTWAMVRIWQVVKEKIL